jgi:serine/threonine-protein kinase
MGVVYDGYDPTLSRQVAIKTIRQNHALGPDVTRDYSTRFMREAKAAARLNHPHIVQVYDFGVEGELAYLVMEFIQGRELRSFFDQDEAFGFDESVRIMRELLDALDFAHEAGVIHRDVKPANVMLDVQRRVKLADFGVARIQDSADHSQGGAMVGTPAYMSPEQVTGGRVDQRTDIFSAGIILYQLLTGVRPFKGAGAWTVAKMIVHDDPPLPSTIADTAPPVFDEIVNQALAKNPADRFSNARDFAAALRRGLEDLDRQNDAQTALPATERREHSRSQSGAQTSDAELAFWRSIQDSNDAAELELYLREFPSGTYAELVRHKIAKLRGTEHAATVTDEAVVEPPTIVALPQPKRKRAPAAVIICAVILTALGGGTYLHSPTSNAPASGSLETDKAKDPLVDSTTAQQGRRAVGKIAQEKAASEKAHREYWHLRK